MEGVTTTLVLGKGAQGTVRLGTVAGQPGGWAAGPVAVKTWDSADDGAAVAADALRTIAALPAAAIESLVAENIVMPLAVKPGQPAYILMPVGTPLANRDWQHVIAATSRMLQSACNVVHMDVKAANLMWHDGTVKFIDHEALCVAGGPVAGLPSYSPWDWDRWSPPPAGANKVDAYFTVYQQIESLLSGDADGPIAVMLWGALCTAITMTTGAGNPVLSKALVETLNCPTASSMYLQMMSRFRASAVGQAATKLNAWRRPVYGRTQTPETG
jgi:hypothetical protein